MLINEKINQLGFGIPSNADEILFNDQHEITLVLKDTLNKGEFTESYSHFEFGWLE